MKKILVIDDDTNYRSFLKDALTKAGYEITEAPDGEAGLRLFRKEEFDLVITDIFMPEKEGIDTIHTLKTEFPDVRIIAVSGGGQKIGKGPASVLKMARGLGADKTLSKPIKLSLLQETVAGFFN